MKNYCWIFAFVLCVTLASVCKGEPVEWHGHLYETTLVPEGISWTDANAAAQAKAGGWYLVTITSAEENAFVFNLISDPAFWRRAAHMNVGPWLGAQKVGDGAADFGWVTMESFDYTNWYEGEPVGNGDRIDFVGYLDDISSSWNDVPASMLVNGYITEIPEPCTLSLLALGSLTLLWRAGRYRLGKHSQIQ